MDSGEVGKRVRTTSRMKQLDKAGKDDLRITIRKTVLFFDTSFLKLQGDHLVLTLFRVLTIPHDIPPTLHRL